MKPTLSIAICTYNRASSLARCLESLARQSHKDFEVIIIDGGSTDQTPQVLKQFRQKLTIRLVTFTEKELAKVRDLGWQKAKGKYVSWIDDDVVVSPKWAATVTEILDNNPDVAGVTGPTIIPSRLLKNRDVFFFYQNRGWIKLVGWFWNRLFLEGQQHTPGRLLKSGAWAPGSNFKSCLKIKGLKEVDYLEACNMTLRKNLVQQVGGYDYSYRGVAEWSELDLAIRVKNLGYRLVFSAKARVNHYISQAGVYPLRNAAKTRMENFFRFYFRHVYQPKLDYRVKLLLYLFFLNLYWIIKAVKTKNRNWLSGLAWPPTAWKYA